jgi:entericidin B
MLFISAMESFNMTKIIRADATYIRAALTGLLFAGAIISLSACNTVKGAGQHVSSACSATTNAASSVQQKMSYQVL